MTPGLEWLRIAWGIVTRQGGQDQSSGQGFGSNIGANDPSHRGLGGLYRIELGTAISA